MPAAFTGCDHLEYQNGFAPRPPFDNPPVAKHFCRMRIAFAVLVSLLALIWPAYGDDRLPTLTVGDTIYTNVLVLRVTATDIFFTSANGIGNAKITNLEPALQAQFAPDAAKAGEVDKIQSEANVEYLRAQALQAPPAPLADAQTPAATNGPAAESTNKPIARSFLGQPGPELIAEKWISAAPITDRRLLLVDFWATTNEPSVSFISTLNGFQDQFTTNLAVVGISHDSEDDVRKIESPAIKYFSAIDTQARMETALDLKKLPYALLMDSNQIVRWEGNPLSSSNKLTDSVISGLIQKYGAPPEAAPEAAPNPNP
jgi:cytochrome c biogenesis protein CcmG, thiol:disulfide interchange protein DsbE